MEKYFKVGQKCWGLRYGWGVIIATEQNARYPVKVQFDNEIQCSYTHDGKDFKINKHPSLYQKEQIITPNVPIVEFEKGELVWVLDRQIDCQYPVWQVRFFVEEKDGEFYCYNRQRNERNYESVQPWRYIRKLIEQEKK